MKKVYSILCILLALTVSANGFAQKKHEDWHQKMQAEKTAYLTTAMGLTPAEAEVFWPVYNQYSAEKHEALKAVRSSYKALHEAIDAQKDEKEIADLLDAYVEASKLPSQIEADYTGKFAKIVSAKKTALLYIGEESFRKMQFQRFQGAGHNGQGMHDGQRPGGGRPQGDGHGMGHKPVQQ